VILQETSEAQLHATLIGPRPEAVAEAEARIKTADALVAFSQAHFDYHTIRAPIDGVLDSLSCRLGQTIAIGSAIGEVVDTRQVFASVWLPPRPASAVRIGQPARVWPADALEPAASSARSEQDGMPGQVAFVGRIADPQTGNLPIRILVDNPKGQLTIGESIRVSIVVEEHKTALQVPLAAILDLGEGPVLSVVRDGKSVVLHPEIGASHAGWVEVSGIDLKAGEPVIVEGGYNLPGDTPVRVADGPAAARTEAQQ
jgi:RND family efflux transporter MFP subunit